MEAYLVFFSAVLLLGVVAQWLAWKFRFPSILALLFFGFASGQFFDQKKLIGDEALFAIVSLAVAVILLEGGLTLRFKELREAGRPVLRLVSAGALVTWILSAFAAHYVAGFSWETAALVGAILVVTGPTVIGPLLRNVRPRRPLSSILKWESIVIDPVGAVLAVLVFGAVFAHHQPAGHDDSTGYLATAISLGKTLLVGFGLGYGAARALVFVLHRHWIPDYLQNVVILAVALVLFTVSNLIQEESGLLMVTVMGIGLVNQTHASVRHIVEFKENLRIILISSLFIVLGGRVGMDEIGAVLPEGLALLAVLIIVVRPAAVFLSTAGTGLEIREKIFLSMMAPRGIVAAAVSTVFALELTAIGGETGAEAARIVPVIFFVIIGTVAFYGLVAAPLARWLGIGVPNPQGVVFAGGASRWVVEASRELDTAGFRVLVIDANFNATQEARMAGLEVVNANVISDYAIDEIDLFGLGRVLAVTGNDHVNSLACIGFSHVLGRSNVFQLQPADMESPERKSSSSELTGRLLFGKGISRETLRDFEIRGATVKSTLLTQEFSLEDFQSLYAEGAIILFVIRENGDLTVMTEEASPPAAGDTLVSFVLAGETPQMA